MDTSCCYGTDADNPCPKCGTSDLGGPIPEDIRHHYGGATRWRKHIGMYDTIRDRVTEWMCCECSHKWPRQ